MKPENHYYEIRVFCGQNLVSFGMQKGAQNGLVEENRKFMEISPQNLLDANCEDKNQFVLIEVLCFQRV